MSSINTNIGAYSAQQNLRTANAATVSSIGKLSSGNRIQRAADDVAGLSVGTILATNVNSLRTGLANAGQANSLLQVADGGLKNITNILQRQKALSVAATSGILSGAERGYLNQEFKNLTAEIDRLVDNTKFNSVKLLDGSLTKQVEVTANANVKTSVGTAVNTGAGIVTVVTPADGTKISILGVEVTFTTQTIGSNLAAGKVKVGNTATETAENLARFLNESGDARLANFYFRNTAGALHAEWGGGLMTGAVDIGASLISGSGVTIPGTTTTIGSAGGGEDFFGRARVRAIGKLIDTNILVEADTSAGGGSGTGEALKLSDSTTSVTPIGGAATPMGLDRTADWIGKIGEGKIGKFEVKYVSLDVVTVSIEVGNIVYTSNVAAGQDITNPAGTETVFDMVGRDKDNTTATVGGIFQLRLRGGIPANSVENQTEANEIANQINAAFQNVVFTQNRDVQSFNPNGATLTNAQGIEILQLDGAKANFRSDNFDADIRISDFKVTAAAVGDAKISVKVNGEEFTSFVGMGNQLKTGSLIVLQGTDKNKALTIQLGNTTLAGLTTTAADISTQENADLIADALNKAFGAENGKAALNFQIGSSSDDSIGVEVQNAGSVALFNGIDLDVLTTDNANFATDALDQAIGRVTALRANIGALQSRFDFASAQLETSIANVDAARSTFLDANISEESTNFAQAQVKLQASISVLAQANQLPQNLLKLIG